MHLSNCPPKKHPNAVNLFLKFFVPAGVRASGDTEAYRRRIFGQICIVMGIPILFFFGISDVCSEKPCWDAIPDFTMATLLAATSIFLRKIKKLDWIFRPPMLAITTLLLFNTYKGVGDSASALWIYTLPFFAAFLFPRKEGIIWTLLAVGVSSFIVLSGEKIGAYAYSPSFAFRFAATIVLISILTFAMETLRHNFGLQVQKQKKLVEEKNQILSLQTETLETALHEIKTLTGLLPICSSCKKIRDDKGYWRDIEHYILSHTDAQLSHSICTGCLKVEFPSIYEEMVNDGEIDPSTDAEVKKIPTP